MSLDYSYLLYFEKDLLSDILLGVADISVKHQPPTQIHFPDSVLDVPIESWSSEKKTLYYNDAELGFETVLIFDIDEAILDWGHAQIVKDFTRTPFGTTYVNPVSVGYIYLTIYNELPEFDFPETDLGDLALFEFGTTGTRMSNMFFYSTSIRKKFIELLKIYDGVCGVFNNEDVGEVFWLNGREINKIVDHPYLLPHEIEKRLLEDEP